MHRRHSFIAIAVVLIGLILIGVAAAHQDHKDSSTNFEGRYNVLGTNPNGDRYSGTLEVIAHGGVYQFRWNAGTQYDGIGVKNGRLVAVAFTNGSVGTGCGVINYNILNDGTLDGVWGNWGTDGSGTERAKHVAGRGVEGQYAATGTNPNGTPYQVNISVAAAGSGYRFVWSNNTEGFGIRRGNNLAVGFGGERCGFVAYELMPDGSLDGVWGGSGSQQTGTEKAIRQ